MAVEFTGEPLALITGAGSGIGAEVAKRLDQKGYQLVISGSNKVKLQALSDSLRKPAYIEVADLSDRQNVENLCNQIKQYPAFDIVFMNAGVVGIGGFSDRERNSIDQELDVNLRSVLHLIHACIPAMISQRRGHILATSSVGGIFSLPGSSVYSATKFALRGFLCSLHQELKASGVKVSGLYPGAIDTEMLRREAVSGGSSLNFLGAPKTVDDVADAFMKTLKSGQLETYIPYSDGVSARLLSVIPWAISMLLPSLSRIGEKGRRKFIKSRNLRIE
jgi:short-subunit dehydrogenase